MENIPAELTRHRARATCHTALLIAPAKEAVMSEFYPIKKGPVTPIEQVLNLNIKGNRVLYPVTELKNSKFRPFRVTDTHWSHYGAREATLALAREFRLELNRIEEMFSKDIYRPKSCIGDLGSKLIPPAVSEEWLVKGVNYRKSIIYDNQLSNNGRVILIYNNDALYNNRCLIFGSSSSYSMFNYLYRIFEILVFVHSAGNLYDDILNIVEPNYLIAQTNERFIVQPPTHHYKLASLIEEKKASHEENYYQNSIQGINDLQNERIKTIISYLEST